MTVVPDFVCGQCEGTGHLKFGASTVACTACKKERDGFNDKITASGWTKVLGAVKLVSFNKNGEVVVLPNGMHR